jgi:16S rRNA (adenine1518-N6/adenine1519-N6)-dimethyltransferase
MVVTTSSQVKRRKALGQHFLVDRGILHRIVSAADLAPEDVVVEVGPGPGILTRKLVQQVAQVVAVELDPHLAASLPQRLGHPPNLTTIEADARRVDLATLVGQDIHYKLVANLPYYAASPIVRRFLESAHRPQLMVVMVQQEVAQSMTARPGGMSLLSVATQYHSVPKLVCTVPPSAFRPPPEVRSAVVRLEPRPSPAVAVADEAAFFCLVRAGFAAPRKQLRNSLSHGLAVSTTEVERLLSSAGLDGQRRAETLSVEEWAQIYQAWSNEGERDDHQGRIAPLDRGTGRADCI